MFLDFFFFNSTCTFPGSWCDGWIFILVMNASRVMSPCLTSSPPVSLCLPFRPSSGEAGGWTWRVCDPLLGPCWTPPRWKRSAGPEYLVAEEWDGISAPLCPHGCLHEEGVVTGSICYLWVVMLIQVITGLLCHQPREVDAWFMMCCCCEVGMWARPPVGPWTLAWEERNVAWLYSATLIWGGNAQPSPPRSASSTITQQERGAGYPRWGGRSEPSHSSVASAGMLRCWDKGWLVHRVGASRAHWSLGLFSCLGLAREGQVWLLAIQFLFWYSPFPEHIKKKKASQECIWHWCSGNF